MVTHGDVNYSICVRAELEQWAGLAYTEMTDCHRGTHLPEVPVWDINLWEGKVISSHAF